MGKGGGKRGGGFLDFYGCWGLRFRAIRGRGEGNMNSFWCLVFLVVWLFGVHVMGLENFLPFSPSSSHSHPLFLQKNL